MSAFQKTILGLLVLIACAIFAALGIVAIAVMRDTRPVATTEQTTEVVEQQNTTPTPMPTITPLPTVALPERANPTPIATPVVSATPFPQSAPSPTSGPYQDIATLAYDIAGVLAEEIGVYEGPDGRKGYDVYIPVTYASERTREEILGLAYDLTYAYYNNFSEQPYFITLHLRPTDYPLCNFGLGIGYRAAAQYLPQNRPQNLESWFAQLVAAGYYGDEPGQSDDWLAYANDPKTKPLCQLSNLQK